MPNEERLASLIDAGMRLAGQVDTFAARFHIGAQHLGPLSECGNGTCRSCLRHLLAWEIAAGDEGDNWIVRHA